MKYIVTFLFFLAFQGKVICQGALPTSFFEGKSIVVVSSDPGARPVLSWQALADSIHHYLIKSGGDPVAYFELEQVALSPATQADYAKAFFQRQIQNIVLVTRQKQSLSIHVAPFSGDGKIIASTNIYGVSGSDWKDAGKMLENAAKNVKSKNLLVIDVPEFPKINSQETSQSAQKFLNRNPLNLEVFKLGIPLEGSSAETGALSSYKYDLYGKSEATILAEQADQKTQLQTIFESKYPHQIQWLTESKTTQQLLSERVQFVLVKVEGRQSDLMKSMGLSPSEGEEGLKTVVKFYIRFLVRDELYIGPQWDAHPDWKVSLTQFLENLKK
jgi:hypothetical protein